MTTTQRDIDLITQSAILINQNPLNAGAREFAPLINMLKNKSFVLLGEATHGTHEFYEARVEITKCLIIDHGLNAIAIEGDWPSAYRVNKYIRWQGTDKNANEALSDFKRFPMWMWRNTVMQDFIIWLRKHNEGLPANKQVGFYGLDMYSMYDSVNAVLEYLDKVDPAAARAARERYGCLDHVGNERHYGYGVTLGQHPSCEDDVVAQLMELREHSMRYVKEGDEISEDDQFQAEQNAHLVKGAESYYRQMFDNWVNTWNLRDTHMIETLDDLHQYLSRRGDAPAKIAVWEHNSHLGDARATYMHRRGQHNVGQLVRECYGDDCVAIGFTTYKGIVTAASEWDGPAEIKEIRKAIPDSVEDIFHQTRLENFFVPLKGDIAKLFRKPRLERAIGVLYLPQTERESHYFECMLSDQFDAIIHYDVTTAIEPLDSTSAWASGERETYPFGV